MHRSIRWFSLGVIALLVLAGVTASAQPNTSPLTVACGTGGQAPDLIPEVRRAAGMAAGVELDRDVQSEFRRLIDVFFADDEDPESSPPDPLKRATLEAFDRKLSDRIAELEWIARGPNAACRQVVEFSTLGNNPLYTIMTDGLDVQPTNTLASLYVTQAFVRAYLATDLQEVGVSDLEAGFPAEAFLAEARRITETALRAETFELGLSRSILTRLSLITLAGSVFSETFILEELLNAEKWRSVACGRTETFSEIGLELDGSVAFIHIDGGGYPFRETAATSWFFAQFLRNPFAVLLDPSFTENLYETAMNGCSAEIRAAAAEFLFQLVGEPNRSRAALEIINDPTASVEFQQAAAPWAAIHWAQDEELTPNALEQRSLAGETVGARTAAGLALGLIWADQVEQGDLGWSSVIEFLGPDGETLRSGTLVQFAGVHTEANPDLARAAVLPLTLLYLADAEN